MSRLREEVKHAVLCAVAGTLFALATFGLGHITRTSPYKVVPYSQPTTEEYLDEFKAPTDCYAITKGPLVNHVYCRMLPGMYRIWGGDKLRHNPASEWNNHDPKTEK